MIEKPSVNPWRERLKFLIALLVAVPIFFVAQFGGADWLVRVLDRGFSWLGG